MSILFESIKSADNIVPTILSLGDQLNLLGINLVNTEDFSALVIRFFLNTFLIFLVVQYMYAKNSRRKDFYFSYLAIGVIVFFISTLLNNVKLELGFALGLFAIFGIIRYRTDAIPIKEMTYLFVIIGISLINALSSKELSLAEILFTNAAIIIGLWFLENRLMLKQEQSIKLIYEKIENIHANSEEILLADLKERTGINIKRIEIKKIDFLKDVAEIILYYNVNGKMIEEEKA